MTKRTIMEMAREAGFRIGPSRDGPDDVRGVGANLRWLEEIVRKDEREACAKVCENLYSNLNDDIDCRKRWPEQLRRNKIYADAIQTRGKS